MEPLSGLDASFLYLETPRNQLHVTGILVMDPSTVPGGYSFAQMREFMRTRLPLAPAFTRKLVRVPLDLAHPVWVEDPDFDLDGHLHRVGLPAPGGAEELAELAGEIAGQPLDHNRPLWEMWFVEGLSDGPIGVVAKMHHATVDGVSGTNLMMHLFDLEPPAASPTAPAETQAPSDVELVAYGLLSRALRPLLLPRALAGTFRAAAEVVRRRLTSGAEVMATPFTAPPTPFNGPITTHRRVAFCSIALAEVHEVRDAFGGTVNDVVLALCSGAARRWLEARDALPERSLVAGVPVSTRGTEDAGAFGANLISLMLVSLATDTADPVERLQSVARASRAAKEEFQAVGGDFLRNWTEFSGPRLLGLGMRIYSEMASAPGIPPPLNLLVSNVFGPPVPLYFGGARLSAIYPLGPVLDGLGLNITALSYLDTIGFGIIGCRELVADLPELADNLALEMAALLGRARAGRT